MSLLPTCPRCDALMGYARNGHSFCDKCRCVTEDNTSSQRVSEIAKSEQVRRKLSITTKARAA